MAIDAVRSRKIGGETHWHADCAGNNIGIFGLKHIVLALEKNATVTEIDLRRVLHTKWADVLDLCREERTDNVFGPGAEEHVARALEKNTTLTKIEVSCGGQRVLCVV